MTPLISARYSSHSSKKLGLALAIGASALWGLSGNVAQALFQNYGFSPEWLVNCRLLRAGLLCLLSAALNPKRELMWKIWRDKTDAPKLVLFAIFGMVGVQYTFFSAIKTGNAPTATLLQYASPLFIVGWNLLRPKRMPAKREALAIAFALPGISLLVTNGNFDTLTVPKSAVVWGLLSAVAAAFYIAYPPGLIKRWGSGIVVGWAMLLGGVFFLPVGCPWNTAGLIWSPISALCVAFVVIFGTFIAFYMYLESLKHISPTEASLLGSAEPLTAAIVSVVFLHTVLGGWQLLGGLLILVMVSVL